MTIGKHNSKGAALLLIVFHQNLTIGNINDALDQGKTQTVAFLLVRAVFLIKLIEYMLEPLFGYAGAAVLYLKYSLVAFFMQLYVDQPVWRIKLYGVADKVIPSSSMYSEPVSVLPSDVARLIR